MKMMGMCIISSEITVLRSITFNTLPKSVAPAFDAAGCNQYRNNSIACNRFNVVCHQLLLYSDPSLLFTISKYPRLEKQFCFIFGEVGLLVFHYKLPRSSWQGQVFSWRDKRRQMWIWSLPCIMRYCVIWGLFGAKQVTLFSIKWHGNDSVLRGVWMVVEMTHFWIGNLWEREHGCKRVRGVKADMRWHV